MPKGLNERRQLAANGKGLVQLQWCGHDVFKELISVKYFQYLPYNRPNPKKQHRVTAEYPGPGPLPVVPVRIATGTSPVRYRSGNLLIRHITPSQDSVLSFNNTLFCSFFSVGYPFSFEDML